MREITSHKLNGLNDCLKIHVLDKPGIGGASHEYLIDWKASLAPSVQDAVKSQTRISFQNSPIKDAGVNGISIEALIAICIDRLQGFQSSAYKCRENAIALTHLEDAMHWLQHRTRERLARGVEGTTAK